ncbi:PIG-L deacetylase family protein [Ilumatobacter coccineus]|nr:PIG-L deacetylase family protein [Ilumatobacter coccineus]
MSTLADRWSTTLAAARPWTPPARRTVVVAPHPDDESLSSGGLIATQRARGLDVIVVAVTDGDAAYDPAGDPALAATRRSEQRAALRELNVAPSATHRLGLPDGRVSEHESALVDALLDIVRPDDLVVTTWTNDGHPDHEACGRAALAVADARSATLVFSLFWTWHWRSSDVFDGCELVALDLGPSAAAAKRDAIRCHVSQFQAGDGVAPILDESTVEPAEWLAEYFVSANVERSDRREVGS